MSVEKAIVNILEGNLDEMRQNFFVALKEKALMKLDEKKVEIGQNYFGQFMEEAAHAKADDEGMSSLKRNYEKMSKE